MGRPKLNVKLVRANFHFPEATLEALKMESEKTGIPQAVIVRQALENRLSQINKKPKDE